MTVMTTNTASITQSKFKKIHTTCAYCGVGCGIEVNVDEANRKISVSGDEHHPANHGRLCSKGSALDQTIDISSKATGQRLLSPKIHGENTSWDTALNKVADEFSRIIRQHGPDSVAFYVSGQLLTEDYYVANKLIKGFMGTANIDTNSRLCMSSSVAAHKRAFGTDTVPGCYEDFENADLITLVGSNTAWCHPVLYQRIKAYKEANPHVKIVVVDPRQTQTCDIADLHLPLKPGSDTWLFNGLLDYLAEHNCIDSSFIEQHTQGFDEALKAAEQSCGNIQENAAALGIEPEALMTFYQWFAATPKSITLYSQGVNQSSAGTDKANSIINCHLATGRIGQPGMGPFSITGQPNAMGGREVGGLANTLAAHMEFREDDINRLQRFWSTDNCVANVATQPGLTAVNLYNAIESGQVKAVWIMATNPVVSMPDADQVKRALKKAELVVVSDCIADTDTGRFAHVHLPATGWSEKNGTVTNSERRISRQRGLLPPAGDAKHDWWILTQVARRMGFSEAFPYETQADIFREHAALSGFENTHSGRLRDFDISGLANITDAEYEAMSPAQWPINIEHPNGRKRFFADGKFFTESGKANFITIEPRPPKNALSDKYPLALNTGRIRDQWHTMTRTGLASRLNQHIAEPYVEMHPLDAQSKGLENKQLIQLNSRWGSMLAQLVITDSQKPGSLFAPMHWTDCLTSKGRVNPLVNPEVDPISNQPESKHTPVDISEFQTQWRGFILSRTEIKWPDIDYLVQVTGDQSTRYEMAHTQILSNPIEQLSEWLSMEPEHYLLSYEDSKSGSCRLAILNQDNQLQAVAFISTHEHSQPLPDRNWLSSQFLRESLDARTRSTLLSGHAPSGEDIGRIICACFSVGENSIKKAIDEHDLNSPEDIGTCLKAGTNCGSCVPELKTLLKAPAKYAEAF